jgi:subtilisin family serine protease
MRLRIPRGRTLVGVLALLTALAVPAAAVSAASPGHGRLTPSAERPTPASGGIKAGQAPDLYLVGLSGSADTFRKEAKDAGLNYSQRFAYTSLFKGVSVRINRKDVGKLEGIASVTHVYPVHYYTLGPTITADPELATAIQMTGADLAQDAGWDGAGVKVAVMDTGIDVDHPDLGGDGNSAAPHPFPNSRIVGGFDFVGDAYNADPESATYNPVATPDAVPDDCNGHGTHVAGIVGADKASGVNGALGVAPEVSFGAYRVFGCDGSTTDDVMIAAMERIRADGMHVLNMSIGDAFNNWAGSPTSAAADALVDAGIVVVASIGNSGDNGIYSAGAPGVGNKVIGVASFDNSHVRAPGITLSGDDFAIAITDSTAAAGFPEPPSPPTSGTSPIKQTALGASFGEIPPASFPLAPPAGPGLADGCDPFPDGFFTGQVALIQRGICTFTVKAQNAQAAGAVAVVLFNNQAGGVIPQIQGVVGIPVVMISRLAGIEIHNRLLDGPVSITWHASVAVENPSGGLISGFSSYGTDAELTLKPDLGAPGGFIRSTYPLEEGGYVTISGTSMASPHVAGAAALLRQARPSLPAARFRDVLQNSADPHSWFGIPNGPFLESVHSQGAGMLDVDDAIAATTTIVPGKLSLGESHAGPATRSVTLTNNSNASVTYDLFSVEAVGTGPETFPPLSFWLPETDVDFSSDSVTVPAGGSATVSVTITADPLEDNIPTGGLYGGYLVFQDRSNADRIFTVPYAGYKGDYQSIVAIPTPPVIGKLNPPFIAGQQIYTKAAANEEWTLQSPDEIPNILIHFDHQVRHLELQVVDAATNKPLHPVFSNVLERDFLARNAIRGPVDGPYNVNPNDDDVTAFPWDGSRMHDNGNGTADHRKTVPDGSYKIIVKALKAGGTASNPAHWETHTSPTITINRP